MDKPDKDFTIIIPAYHEAANIEGLAKRIASVDFGERAFEVLLMDDNSNDDSVEIVNQLKPHYPWLNIIVRKNQRDLSQAVIQGFESANHSIMVTMDADLSHPPEKIPQMLALLDVDTDIVIGSRYVKGGSVDEKWPFYRKLTSRLAAFLAKIVLPGKVKDPLSGFLAVRKKTFESGDPLTPKGWKIGLELMVKCHCKRVREIPIHFSQRRYGKSKLNTRISIAYLRHLFELVIYNLKYRKTAFPLRGKVSEGRKGE